MLRILAQETLCTQWPVSLTLELDITDTQFRVPKDAVDCFSAEWMKREDHTTASVILYLKSGLDSEPVFMLSDDCGLRAHPGWVYVPGSAWYVWREICRSLDGCWSISLRIKRLALGWQSVPRPSVTDGRCLTQGNLVGLANDWFFSICTQGKWRLS